MGAQLNAHIWPWFESRTEESGSTLNIRAFNEVESFSNAEFHWYCATNHGIRINTESSLLEKAKIVKRNLKESQRIAIDNLSENQ